jgi:medium-chain acyl-[acyl-carrier-protein] hydrolase
MSQLKTNTNVFEPWIACRKPNPRACLRLFCLPYAGGSASIFHTWPDGLPADVEICPIQLPGRGSRLMERPFTQLLPLVEALAQDLVPLLDVPFAFFGHSLGALVSFELARHLRSLYGIRPVRLIVSACRAPQFPHRDRPIHTSPEREFLAQVRCLNGTPTELLEHEELMEIVLPLLRADFALYETYVYSNEPPLGCPISAFRGLQDRRVSHSDLDGWGDQTSAAFSLRTFPGDHFFLNTNQPLLLRVLSQELR